MVTRDLVLVTVFVILVVVVAATVMRVVRKGSSCVIASLLQKDRSHPRISFTRPRVAVAGRIRLPCWLDEERGNHHFALNT